MYEVYKYNLCQYQVNDLELTRLFEDLAQQMGKLKYELDENRKHSLFWDKYRLFLSIKERPTLDEVREPRLTISISYTLKEAPAGKGIFSLLSDKEREPYRTKITVAINRGVKIIAREINTRLWQDYLTLYQMALAKYQSDRAIEEQQEQITQSLAAIIDALPDRDNQIREKLNLGLKDSLGITARISDTTHYLELRSVPTELLTEIFQLIASRAKETVYETWLTTTKEAVLYELNEDLGLLDTPAELLELPPNNYDWRSAFNRRIMKFTENLHHW